MPILYIRPLQPSERDIIEKKHNKTVDHALTFKCGNGSRIVHDDKGAQDKTQLEQLKRHERNASEPKFLYSDPSKSVLLDEVKMELYLSNNANQTNWNKLYGTPRNNNYRCNII